MIFCGLCRLRRSRCWCHLKLMLLKIQNEGVGKSEQTCSSWKDLWWFLKLSQRFSSSTSPTCILNLSAGAGTMVPPTDPMCVRFGAATRTKPRRVVHFSPCPVCRRGAFKRNPPLKYSVIFVMLAAKLTVVLHRRMLNFPVFHDMIVRLGFNRRGGCVII